MPDAPISTFAVVIALFVGGITFGTVANFAKLRQGVKVIAGAVFLLAWSLLLAALLDTSASDIRRVFTFRSAEEPSFIAGYVWGAYGMVVGALAGTLALYWLKSRGKRNGA